MDGLAVIFVALVFSCIYRPKHIAAEDVVEAIELKPTLNPEMLHDEHAFMRIANGLGFN